MNAVEMKNITKSYQDFKLDGINLTLPSGCIMGLVGENGAGKSTTIKLIMNAIESNSGSVTVFGVDNKEKSFTYLKEEIGIVLDEAYFPEVLNAKQVNAIMKNTYKNWDEECYFSYLDRFGLPLKKSFKDYSRGMKMKLAIATALSHNPKLLLLDEATSGLDPMVRDEILDIFNEFTRDESHSILLSSHITSDLEKICDYITFLHQGKLIFSEEKDRLLEKYGMLHCSKSDFDTLDKETILGYRDMGYSYEVLVKREDISREYQIEKANIEEIVLLLVKGEKQK